MHRSYVLRQAAERSAMAASTADIHATEELMVNQEAKEEDKGEPGKNVEHGVTQNETEYNAPIAPNSRKRTRGKENKAPGLAKRIWRRV